MTDLRKKLEWAWLVALLIFPIALWILPADFFDGEGGVVVCPSRLFFDFECYGCGMTRAITHLHHGQLEDAVYYNLLSPIVYIALVVMWFIWVRSSMKTLGIDIPGFRQKKQATSAE
jgi:hypothetical protein